MSTAHSTEGDDMRLRWQRHPLQFESKHHLVMWSIEYHRLLNAWVSPSCSSAQCTRSQYESRSKWPRSSRRLLIGNASHAWEIWPGENLLGHRLLSAEVYKNERFNWISRSKRNESVHVPQDKVSTSHSVLAAVLPNVVVAMSFMSFAAAVLVSTITRNHMWAHWCRFKAAHPLKVSSRISQKHRPALSHGKRLLCCSMQFV